MAWSATGASVFNRSYSYDPVNRLATLAAPGDQCSGLSWSYDAWGNRLAQTPTGGTCNSWSASYDSSNQPTNPDYTFDAAGNMTHDGSHSYTYDAENRITQVDGGSTASYIYDAEGHRVQKTAGGVTTNYVYDLSGHVLAEYSCYTCWNVGYIYLNGALKAIYTNNTTYFVHADHLGSIRLLTGYPTPSIVECDDYYPFGELTSCGGSLITAHEFTSKERDSESNLDNFGARYYSSQYGRFMSPDPLGNFVADPTNPQSWNMYSYVLNNPLSLVDPTGYDACYWDDGTNDDDPEDGGATQQECGDQGGTWIPTLNQSITVNGDTGESDYTTDTWMTGDLTQPQQQQQSYAQCVKSGGNFFSLQHGLQSLSGGRLGNGWLSSALLGNSISGGIGFFQSLGQGNVGQATSAAAGEAFSRGGGSAALRAAAAVPNVAVSVAGAAGASIETAGGSASVSMAGQLSGIVPTGTLARAGAGLLNTTLEAVGQIKDPIDLTASSFAAVVCSIGR